MKKRITGAVVLVILGIVLPLLLVRWLQTGDTGDSASMRVYEVAPDGQARAADEPTTATNGQPGSAGSQANATAGNAAAQTGAARDSTDRRVTGTPKNTPPMPQAVSPAAMDDDTLASSDSESFETPPVQGNAGGAARGSASDAPAPAAGASAAANDSGQGNPQAANLRRSESQTRGWIVQVASFGDEDYAQRLANELVGEFDAFYRATDVNGKTWYRVAVGPFDSEEKARSVAAKMRQQGRSTLVRQSG